MITTEAMVAELPKEKEKMPAGGMGGMEGMISTRYCQFAVSESPANAGLSF